MRLARSGRCGTSGARRKFAVALALFALLLQTHAPLEILPPRGQAVHFAHAHHGGQGENERGGDRERAPRPDAPSCPVCQALQAGGQSIAAPAVLLPAADLVYAAPPAPIAIEAPAAPALARARARAPPTNA